MPAPSNDDFANAIEITWGVSYTGTLVGSTIEANEYGGWDAQYGAGNTAALRAGYPYTVWYKIVSDRSDPQVVTISGDPGAYAYILQYVGGFGPGADSQDNIRLNGDTTDSGVFGFAIGRAYYFQVVGDSPPTGSTFTFVIGDPDPPPDLTVTVNGSTQVHAALNTVAFFADVRGHGGPVIAVLQLDNNVRVDSYDGDPWTPGGVTGGAPPLKNDAITYPAVALQEAVGASQDTVLVTENLTLLGVDAHSNADSNVFAYTIAPVSYPDRVYTCERWIRLRFAEPFNTVQSVRFWSPTDLTGLNTGWDIRWGVTDTYETPVATASSIATNELPTSDPGIATYDLLDVPAVDGNETRYSKWLVIQASLSAPTDPGAMLRFTPETSQPVPLELAFAWLET